MIGSALSQMATAEKLSVPQLQQAIKDGTLPAYIGVPLLQEKVKQQKMAQAAQPRPAQPPIAQQVMQEASQEEQGVQQLPSGMPEQGFALGGIVAFAPGGDVDEDSYSQAYQDAKDEERDADVYNAAMERMDINATQPTGLSYAQVQGQAPRAARQQAKGLDSLTGANHKYAATALKYAEKYGVDPKLALHVLNKETGGIENPEGARSKAGAMGVMQLMPKTAKMLGVKDPNDPEQNIEGGIRYLSMLKNNVGNDNRLIAAAYNAGPGNVRKYGDVPPFAETQGYVKGLKEGGIAHFADGDVVPTPTDDEDVSMEQRIAALKERFGFGKMLPPEKRGWSSDIASGAVPTVNVGSGTLARPLSNKDIENLTAEGTENATYNWPSTSIGQTKGYATPAAALAARDGKKPAAAPSVDQATTDQGSVSSATPTSSESYFDQFMKDMVQSRQKRQESAKQDQYMGLLTAGLGMMSGTSPYAMTNIGQGALGGVSMYSNLQKQRAAEEAADLKNLLTAQHYKSLQDTAEARLGQQKELSGQTLQQKQEASLDSVISRIETRYTEMAKAAAANEIDPTAKQQKYDEVIRQMHNDQRYRNALKARYKDDAESMLQPLSGGIELPQGVKVSKTS